jgi:hypothetical protein
MFEKRGRVRILDPYGFKSRSCGFSRLQVYVTCVVEYEVDDFSEACEAVFFFFFGAGAFTPS